MKNPSSEPLHRLASPIPLAGVQPVSDWKGAQDRVNFVIVGPRAGVPWQIRDATVRGESPAHHSTLRYFLEDGEGRRLRVKQSYNDWWIPTIADISFRAPGRPIVFGEEVAFVGRDYRRHEASCGHRWGTSVEFSLESGTLEDAAWAALWQGLEPRVPSVVSEARATPFARRNYWNRWHRTVAPWDTSEISSLTWTDPTNEALSRAAWAITADRWASLPGALDSLGFHAGPQGEEVQAMFRWPMTLNASAWLRVLREPSEGWRPLIDAGEVNRPSWAEVELSGHPVRRAGMDPIVGNWMYAWRDEAKAYELHLRAHRGFTAERADTAVRALLAS